MPQQKPADIEAEIERTRGELADTIDAIAEKVSPKRAVTRTADKVKMAVKGDTRARVTMGVPETGERVTMIASGEGASDEPGAQAGSPGPTQGRTAAGKYESSASDTGLPGGLGGSHTYSVERRLRVDRVLMAVGAAVALVTLVALMRRGGKSEFDWQYEDFEDWQG